MNDIPSAPHSNAPPPEFAAGPTGPSDIVHDEPKPDVQPTTRGSLISPNDPHKTFGHKRSDKWPAVERAHLEKEGWCRNCGGTISLQVHHVMPFHLDPTKELDPSNLITLCEDVKDSVECHLHIGHLGSWKNFNPAVRSIADSPKAGAVATHLKVVANGPIV